MKTTMQNLLMFLGTRKEVDEASVVNRCFYFAWDTGEIFLGNNHNSKTKYGGSRKTLSETDIRKIVDSEMLPQLAINNETTKDIALKQDSFIKNINEQIKNVVAKVDTINENTTAYIKDQVDAVLKDMETSFYTKDTINEMLANYLKINDFNTSISNYYTKTESDKKFLLPVSGDYLYKNVIKLNGYYLCTSDYTSNDYNFYLGTIYQITNGRVTEIASAGGGGGSDVSVKINSFLMDGKDYILKHLGYLLGANTKVQTNIQNGKYISSSALRLDDNLITNNVPTDNGDQIKFYDLSSTYLTAGRHKLSLDLLTKTGNHISSDINIDIVRPFYYGSGRDTTPELTQLNKGSVALSPKGKYNITTTTEFSYVWFAIPINGNDAMTVSDVTANGFIVPTITMVKDDYRFIRSANAIKPGTATITLDGSASSAFN